MCWNCCQTNPFQWVIVSSGLLSAHGQEVTHFLSCSWETGCKMTVRVVKVFLKATPRLACSSAFRIRKQYTINVLLFLQRHCCALHVCSTSF